MATPSDPASPAALLDATTLDGYSDTPHSHSASSSHTDGEAAEADSVTCRWKTSRFHDQECSRYFDCPSHTVERRLSSDQTEERPESPALVFQTDELPYDIYGDRDTSNQHSTTSSRPDSIASAESSARDITLRDGLASAGSAGAAQTSTLPHETEDLETMERGDGYNQPGRISAQSELVSAMSSFDPFRDMEHPGQSNTATGTSTEAPQLSTPRQVQPPLGEFSGDYSTSRRGSRVSSQGVARQGRPQQQSGASASPSDFVLPRWQRDAEVTYCPICRTQFGVFVRKHHCRKCGRVVCSGCSPHRIIIPHQYIVRPPGSETDVLMSMDLDSFGVGFMGVNGMSGGERVRLCNPCVPDPNTTPPQTAAGAQRYRTALTPRERYQRSRRSIGDVYLGAPSQSYDTFQTFAARNRATSMQHQPGYAIPGPSSSRHRVSGGPYPSAAMPQYPAVGTSSTSVPSYSDRYESLRGAPSSSRQRNLPPTPQIAEEDECPICHRELPPRRLPNFESLRESHINSCIRSHSSYGPPDATAGENEQQPAPPPRRTGMYVYPATEKDCIDDAECTICLEEFTVGVPMARLECLCRFHRTCISAWFIKHPGRCPVHQHGSFGY